MKVMERFSLSFWVPAFKTWRILKPFAYSPNANDGVQRLSPPKSSGNFDGVQGLRFIAALLVVITHSTFYATERLGAGGAVWPRGVCGVDIFFVISGFVMVASTRRTWGRDDAWKNFALRRLIRIMPMYWLATTVKLSTFLIFPAAILHSHPTILHVVSSYLLIPTTNIEGEYAPLLGVGWTLDYEMFFYALFTFALFVKKNVFYFLGTILSVASVLSIFCTPGLPAIAMYANSIVLEFFFGMLIAGLIFKLDNKLPLWAGVTLALAGGTLLLAPLDFLPRVGPRVLADGVPAALLVLGVVSLESRLKGRIPRIVILFGDASYVLYLFHPLIAPIVPELLRKLGIHVFSLSVLLSISLTLCVTALIHISIEQHATHWLKKLVLSRPASTAVAPAQ
jgi:exopolysaccharide production protein ExoZ